MTFWLALAVAFHASQWLTLTSNFAYLRSGSAWKRPKESPEEQKVEGRLSVLVPAFNEAENLRRLLPSLLEQDHSDVEIIVIDDASTDDTARVVAGFSTSGSSVRLVRTDGPPPGWLGKVHALYQGTRDADGNRYLFLDADVRLLRPDSLRRIERAFSGTPDRLLSAIPTLEGGGLLLVSLVGAAILNGLPWALARATRLRSLGAINGQCWMIDASVYHEHEPHRSHAAEILEDVQIGRYFMAQGRAATLVDLRDDLRVRMYDSFGDAWVGFRKNAYLIVGGSPIAFLTLWTLFVNAFIVAPWLVLPLLASVYLIKAVTDRWMRMPIWVTLLAPLAYLLSALLQLDSALRHLTGTVSWKGRRVSPQKGA